MEGNDGAVIVVNATQCPMSSSLSMTILFPSFETDKHTVIKYHPKKTEEIINFIFQHHAVIVH